MTATAANLGDDPQSIRRLADEYRDAAAPLMERRRHGEPLSLAPYRLIAIHAVELYLNAVLRHHGVDEGAIRALGHDLGARLRLAESKGLKLKKLTTAHLQFLAETKEYVQTRYRPLALATPSQLNRLQATLDEVARKSVAVIDGPGVPLNS
jgi:hypothetical protein